MLLNVGKTRQYKRTKLGRVLHGMSVAHATKIGGNTLEKIYPFHNGIFANMGYLECELGSIAKLGQSASTLKSLIVDLVVDCVTLMSKEIKGKYLSLMCDKGQDNGAALSFVKLLLFWDDSRDRFVVRCFGIEQAGNTSKDAALAIYFFTR